MSRKIFVLDTSVLLYDRQSIHVFTGNDIILPLVVLEELDRFKDRPGLVGENARYINRFLDDLREIPADKDGFKKCVEHDVNYKFELNGCDPTLLPKGLDKKSADNLIISCALYMKEHNPDSTVKVVTKDINLRVKCDAINVQAEDYFRDHIEDDEAMLSGWAQLDLLDKQVDNFYENKSLVLDQEFFPNQFVIGKSENKSFLGIHQSSNN